ncbi:related to tetratricopeptide repeat protein 2, dnajc7 [Armillaria ostoyae]|uniref:Related to tetratricopeptide repeat protein 2, dnajc7 n=1 Tax=Armillaria ostoyae TaxID=47428 RepID=A0A284R9L9_ARMOS|nr:related to tetratricopeptide repeat protein 2, dnajc7 [Armillaria ostoyae]
MVSKKTKQARRAAKAVNGNAKNEDTAPTESAPTSPKLPEDEVVIEEEVDPKTRAERIKEEGNAAFRAKNYRQATELYTQAIDLNPAEPSYLTNRAASSMALKRFKPALEDCRLAAKLQASSLNPKTLLRLARCQFALGSPTPALSTLNTIFSIDPKNDAALQLKRQISDLEGHLQYFHAARGRKDWAMARIALDKCFQNIESEGDEIPTDWRVWRVELELAKGNWDAANIAANDALRMKGNSPEVLSLRGLVLFLTGKLPSAITHVQGALRLDPSYGPAQQLRKRVKDVERLKEEGNVAFKAGRLTEAVEKYGETLERIGASEEEGKGGQIRATLLSNRATTLVKLERYDEALVDIEESLELMSTSFKAYRTRARIHLHLESYDKAVADFKSAIQQAQSDGNSTDADIRALKAELKKAETALKQSKTKDYYKILGVPRECSTADIKKAYRRESLKHHPDKGGDEEQFKLVAEAHSVLSDSDKRSRYDNGDDEDGMDGGGFGGMGNMTEADIANLFAQFGGGGFGGGGGGYGGGGYGGSRYGGSNGYSSHGFHY